MTYDDLQRPPLDVGALTAALGHETSMWHDIEVLAEAPSTNAVAARRARVGATEGVVVVAEHQTAGRGRLDRVWETPARAALTFSMLVVPDRVPTGRWPWLPLLAGIAVSEAVRRVTDVDCELKWPNDVLVGDPSIPHGSGQGLKLAGILVERVEARTGPAAVVGVGLNVSTTRGELPVPSATSLSLSGARTLDRSVILREVLRTFEALYAQWQADSGDPDRGLLASYLRRCGTVGRHVRVAVPTGEHVTGLATGIDADGRLLVSTESGQVTLGAGDVVHVRHHDA